MKRLLPAFLIVVGGLFASAAHSQVYVNARIHLPIPPLPPMPHVNVYAQTDPYYSGYGGERVVVTEPVRGCRDYGYDRDYRYGRNWDRGDRYHEDRYRDGYRDRGRYEYGRGRDNRDHDRRNW
ncbi:MAG: hypothetical protein JST58_05170 [Bacteroidetes bacterium]|nr:hypothetical protein [Bacteroidota bacterium]